MRLCGSLMHLHRYHEHLADLDVIRDTHGDWGDGYVRRLVEGTVSRKGPIWNDYIAFWSATLSAGVSPPLELDGKRYMAVTLLQVDYDLYTPFAWVNTDGPTLRLVLLEHFDGRLEDYPAAVAERNRKVQAYLDWIDRGRFTRNDMRESQGLPREPRFDEPISPEAVQPFTKTLLDPFNPQLRNVLW